MEYAFSVNGIEFTVGQIPHGDHEDKWCWSTSWDEGTPMETAAEAQQEDINMVIHCSEAIELLTEAEENSRSYADSVEADYRDAIRVRNV